MVGFLQKEEALWYAANEGRGKAATSFTEFRNMLCARFFPSNMRNTAQNKLKRLPFSGSMAKYVSDFNSIVAEATTALNEEPIVEDDLIHYFMAGLKRAKGDVGVRIYESLIHHRTSYVATGRKMALEEVQRYAQADFRVRGHADRGQGEPSGTSRGEATKASASPATGAEKGRKSQKGKKDKGNRSSPYPRPSTQDKGKGSFKCHACHEEGHGIKSCPKLQPIFAKLAKDRGQVAEVNQALGRMDLCATSDSNFR